MQRFQNVFDVVKNDKYALMLVVKTLTALLFYPGEYPADKVTCIFSQLQNARSHYFNSS